MAVFDFNPQRDLDYQFTISGGSVTDAQVIIGRHAVDLHVPRNVTLAVDGADVVATIPSWGGAQVITFTPEAGSTSLYEVSDVKTSYANPSTANGGYAFKVSDGVITGGGPSYVQTFHGHTYTQAVSTPLDAIFTKDGGTVTEQYAQGNEIDTIVYTQPSGSNLYAIASTERTFIDQGASKTALDVNPQDRLELTFDGSGAVSQVQRLDAQGGLHTVAANAHVTYSELAPGYVEQVTTHGSQSSYVVYYEGSSQEGVYTEVAHGSGSTVDLAGLQAQVAQAETHLPTTSYSTNGWVI